MNAPVFAWFNRWRQMRRLKALAKMRRLAKAAAPPAESVDFKMQTINEIEKNNLARMELESKIKLAELAATAEERKEDREYERKRKEKEREFRAQQAATMRERRKGGGRRLPSRGDDLPLEMQTCEDCQAALQGRAPGHNLHMILHAGHIGKLSQILKERRSAAAN